MFKKNELLFIVGIACVALLLWFVSQQSGGGGYVQVMVDGEQRMMLPANRYGKYEVLAGAGAHNVIEISAQGVRMVDADCPDQWCMRKGTVARGADTIVCLPHKLIVRWADAEDSTGESDEVDVVVQ